MISEPIIAGIRGKHRRTCLILVLSGLGVHQDLGDTVERSKNELVEHETDHDGLRATVWRRDS